MSRARKRSASAHGRRGKRPGVGRYLLFGLVFAVLLGATFHWARTSGRAGAGAPGAHAAPAGTSHAASTTPPPADPTTTPPASAKASGTTAPSSHSTTAVPEHGTGKFSTADASAGAAGHGRIRRYKVEVEGGAGISSGDAAKQIQGILADPRGWTTDGRDGFKLVASGTADFVVKIATPDTVDAICGAAGLDTHGEVNCDVGPTVVVNLKRWLLGSPQFPGSIDGYRALIINHEVGHRIGHGHEGCPGPGKLAPVMMQQIYGLHGCKANAWPYGRDGVYIQGPKVP